MGRARPHLPFSVLCFCWGLSFRCPSPLQELPGGSPQPCDLRGKVSWRCQSEHFPGPLLGTSLRMGSQPPASHHWPGKENESQRRGKKSRVGLTLHPGECESWRRRGPMIHLPAFLEGCISGLPRDYPHSSLAPLSVGGIPPAGYKERRDPRTQDTRKPCVLGGGAGDIAHASLKIWFWSPDPT